MQVFQVGSSPAEENKLAVVGAHGVRDSGVRDHSARLRLGGLPTIHRQVINLQVVVGVASEAAKDVELVLDHVDRGAFARLG